MGSQPKSTIEALKRAKREAKASKKRKVATRDKIVRFLIVCEGERTEPSYFRDLVKDKYSEVRSEEIIGEGRATCALVKRASDIKTQIERQRQLQFDRTWVVFDKDDFNDFNEAIAMCGKLGFNAAWSNEAFELWYLLHFVYLDSAISRSDYIKKLESEIQRSTGNKSYRYQKNDTATYQLLKTYGSIELAKRYASRLRTLFEGNTDYNSHKPCTTVDLLIADIENPGRSSTNRECQSKG